MPQDKAVIIPPVHNPDKPVNFLAGLVLAVCGGLLIYAGCSSGEDGRPRLMVFAATSLTDALAEVGREFEAQSNVKLSYSYGGSQALAQQIARGAPADVFISAGQFPTDFLVSKDLAGHETVNLLTNKLVLVLRPDNDRLIDMKQLATETVERIAIANPDLAPAGRYAKEALEYLDLWEAVQDKLVAAPDVRATMTYVETGNADVAVVYQTDAMTADDLEILDIVPPESYSQITYPAVIPRRSERKSRAIEFIEFLQGDRATMIFRSLGFEPLGQSESQIE